MYKASLLAVSSAILFTNVDPACSQATVCDGTFQAISAQNFIDGISPGWNLGNTLDAFPNEDSWNNVPVVESVFDGVKGFGFRSVRLPVTWAYHFVGATNQGESPSWTVDPAWLQRVSDVVDMVTARDLYTIVNVHHDSALWADLSVTGANYTMIEEKFYRLWYQIGQKLACKSSLLAFEPINEPRGESAEHAAELHKLNDIFLQAINDAGGFNPQRVVTLSGPGQDIIRTSLWFEKPDPKYPNPYALQVHYYGPYDFTSAAWGRTIWGSEEDKAILKSDFSQLRGNFSDIPIVLGEWLVSPIHSEPAARWKYYDFISRLCLEYGLSPIIWDTGNDHVDRSSSTLRDPTGLGFHMSALSGAINSLADSTTDASSESQSSSAFVFHQVGDPIIQQTLPWLLNGNHVASISDTLGELTEMDDFTVDEQGIQLSASYLARYFDTTSSTGVKTTLSISFSEGAAVSVQLVQWSPPGAPVAQSKAPVGDSLRISVDWHGVAKPAAVAAFKADGTPLVDEWTTVLPSLRRGRTTFGGQWTWDWDQDGVTISESAMSAVINAGQDTTFMIEAFPRVEGNYVNYTVFP
ncbi:putative extracellular endoglucanase [Dactylonectria macrodidyma]|uniref:Extracellular endoglucanase n=1 Tax=Dactylonectria macrodidyma TaxID=307937 RepID=A0A9P9DBX8_9HYPO|nr:putative extracellular endoglucanase [Dactylonectria macrodidyma]